MATTRPYLLTAALTLLSAAPLGAQARSFAGRLVSRELSIASNCATLAPPAQILGTGLPLPLPKLPACAFLFSSGTERATAPVYSLFNVDFPAETPGGSMNPSGAIASVDFSQPLTFRLATSAGWSLRPPDDQSTGTHRATYAFELDQAASDFGSCSGANASTNSSGSLAFDTSCSLRRTAAAWDAATQTARFAVTATIGFRFGNANGEYAVRVKAVYALSALEADRIEILQTVQTSDNRVPLVAGKAALVRVFPVGGESGGAQIQLNIYRGDRLVQSQESGTIPLAGGGGAPRDDLSRTANFIVPAALATAGPVRFDALLKPAGAAAYGPPKAFETAFQGAPGWPDRFGVAQLELCPPDCAAGIRNLADGLALFAAIAPPAPYALSRATAAATESAEAFRKLFQLRYATEAELYVATAGGGANLVEPDPVFAPGFKRLAYLGGDAAVTLPCVIGLNLGLARIESTIGDPGLHPSLDRLIGADTPDFMTCDSARPSWIGAANAIQLFDAYKGRGPGAGADAGERTVISGAISAGGTATFDAPLRVRGASLAGGGGGSLCLRFFNKGAQTGADHCFSSGSGALFATAAAMPLEADRIALFDADRELGSLSRSANAPALRFASKPTAAPDRYLSLAWTATDADGDALRYQIWASRDGGETFTPLAVDLAAPSFLVDTARLAPAPSALLQVRVSDGFNETIETLGPVALDAKPAIEAIAPVRMADSRWNEGRIVQIPIVNSGPGTLRIAAVESSLPALSYSGPDIAIAAGESASLPLLFTAADLGAFSASIAIKTNDPAKPSVLVAVDGAVFMQQGPAASLGAAALDFGPVSATAERAVRITNRGNAPLSLTNISVGATQTYRLTGANTASIAPGASADITVRCAPVSANYVTGALTASTNDLARPSISVPLGCEGATVALEVPAGVVDFGSVASGQARSQTVTIRNTSTQALNITGAVFGNAQFRLVTPRLPFALAAATSANLDIQFAPTVGGVATSTLSLSTDNPAVSGQISLRGTGTGSTQINGRLAVDPNQLAFGEVVLNQSRTLTLTLSNAGTGQLTITGFASNNPAFALSGVALPLAIAAAGSVEAQIRFSPASATSYNSVLTISSDSITGSDLFLSLTGTGLPIPATTVSNLAAPLRQDWTARATLVSLGPDEANLRLVRYDSSGLQLNDTGLTIPAGAQLLPDIDAGSGWAQARVAKGEIEGYVQFSAQQAQTFDVAPLSAAIGTRFVMTGLERGSDILLNNLASDNNTIALELRNNNAAVIGTQTVTLASRATLFQRLEQLFGNAPLGFQGYLLITGSQPLQATRTNNGGTAMEVSPAQPATAAAARNVVLYAPRIQAGNGWLARLQVVNPTDRDARLTIRAASSAGGSVGTTVLEIVPAGRAYWREFTQMFNLDGNITWNASLTVESSVAGVVAEVSYGNSFARAAAALSDVPVRRSTIPVNTSNTTLYILNPNAAPAAVSLLNLLEGGAYGTGRRITIAAGGYYGGPSGLTASPALRIESDVPVVAQAAVAADQVIDFGILPALALGGETIVTPPAGVAPRLQVDPPSLDFGSIVLGQSRTLTLSIRNGGTAALTVTSIASSSARFAAEGALPLTLAAGSTQQVLVRFTPVAPAAIHTGTLTVTSNDILTGPVTIGVNGTGTAIEAPRVRIDVSPGTLDFASVNSGQTKDLPLLIRNLGTDSLTINSVAIGNSRFQLVSVNFPLTVLPSGLVTLQVRFSPASAGAQTGTLTLLSNDGANPSVSVALRGTGVGAAASPRIDVSVAALEFGPVTLGQLGERTFEIRNAGVAPLIIQSMTLDNSSYAAGPVTPFTLAPNAIADIGVNFRPKDVGNQPANLRIISNDPVNGSVVIPITGSGQ